ncbi:MAG: outer membrane beta-barrel protein [Steroidobacteraceae bacterium]
MLRKLLIPACALSLCAGNAVAADNGFYLGAAASQSQIDGFTGNFDLKDTGYKVIAGFRPLDVFAVELNYMDLGSDSATLGAANFSAEATALAGFGMLMLPLPFVDLYVKAGVARWEAKGSLSSVTVSSLKDSGTEFAYGAGVQAHFGSLGARLEYESFDIENTDGLDLFSLGLTWTFL